ncbi:MerR family transcriptional regulator [Fusibacter paucivorans]|uniref:MerR family transcriptional regulator n=1 Tax=Fusibacter paucivorans TaxID=76009 RepID=A0ABS5PJE2_9FIRM|nr:MerR family transcriptional regulator [Fusibacter paucivorans]MBS7525240.1 MerR family transcriptional regulator [Fusibacter paucivorans]
MYLYSITDLAALIGCTTSAIRYFEKENLISVEKDSKGHRVYDIVDVFRLISYEKYRSMGFPMKTVVKQFAGKENSRAMIEEREAHYKNKALEMAAYYQSLADAIESHLSSIRRIDDLFGSCELAMSPEMFVICDEDSGWLSKNRTSQQLLQSWIKAMPKVQLAVLHRSLGMSDFGYLIDDSSRKVLELPVGLMTRLLPSKSCLHTIVAVDKATLRESQTIFEEAIAYAKEKRLTVGDMAWGKILLVEVGEEDELKIFIELWISIKI